ncbi:helix-turn-helix transcriptional regulator [Clostridium sp. YIM B02506]|uniref:helix-turn-helix domain-containing protein n=1 Tax=Clostridium sp. YIM B02506 TaxID=2910680 RepID=UPI001EED40F6|nr:helix-turn-helix transcriptional regulator [Clostridium sp. YIM B02506]
MNIGINLKNRREKLGISQRDLAKVINKTGQLISLIEQDKNKPSLDVLEQIAKALKIPIYELIKPSKDLGSTEIMIKKVEFIYDGWKLYRGEEEINNIEALKAITVEFSYRNISNAKIGIKTDRELTLTEIKEKIINEMQSWIL